MDTSPSVLVILTFAVVAGALFVFEIWLIKSYLKSKPLGLQTTFDTVCLDVAKLLQLFLIAYMLVVISRFLIGPVDPMFAKMVITPIRCLVYLTQSQIFVAIAIRYMSIYHSNIIHNLDETKLVRKLRVGVALTALTFLSIDLYRGAIQDATIVFRILTSEHIL